MKPRGPAARPWLVLLLWCAAPAPGAELPAYFVGEVVVTEEDADHRGGAGAVDVIDAEEIRRLGATTVAEAVEHLAGVSMSVGSRNEQRIWVRGYEPADVLVLLDGVPIADPYSGEVDLGHIQVADVAHIVVSRGGASPLYGPGSLGGVINIVTVAGAEEHQISGELRAAEESTLLTHAAIGGGTGRLRWYLGAGSDRSDGWQLARDYEASPYQPAGLRLNSDFARSTVLGRMSASFDDGGRLTASVRLVDADKGIPFHTERPAGFVRFARFPEWRQGTGSVAWDGELGGGVGLRAQLFGHRFDNTLDLYSGPELDRVTLSSAFSDHVLGGFASVDASLGRHGIAAALHLREDRHQRLETAADAAPMTTERYTSRIGSLAVEDRIVLGSRATLLVAAAVEHHAVRESWQLAAGDGVEEATTRFSPQAELRLGLGGGASGFVSLYRRSRFPTLRQMYGADVPNPWLKPQRATGATAGVRWEGTAAASLDARLYLDRVDDVITRLGRGYPYENQDEAEMSGLELSGQGQWGRFDLRVALCVQRAEFVRSSAGIDDIPYVPEASVEAGVGVRVGSASTVRANWRWVGSRAWYDGPQRQELDPYRLLRLAVGHSWSRLELAVEADNLLDRQVEQEWGYPLPGRRLWLVLRARL